MPNEKDAEIDYMNAKRSIPYELSETEQLLYTFSQGVTLQELEQLYQKYKDAQQEQSEDPQLPLVALEDVPTNDYPSADFDPSGASADDLPLPTLSHR